MLDAPVTGGDRGAKAGTLSILVGGEREDCEACMDIFRAMGSNITYYGPSGAGQHAKLANQIMQASIMSGVCEALAYVREQGLDPEAQGRMRCLSPTAREYAKMIWSRAFLWTFS